MSENNNGFDKWKIKILSDLEEVKKVQKETNTNVNKLLVRIAVLEYKASLWGGVGAVIVLGTSKVFGII